MTSVHADLPALCRVCGGRARVAGSELHCPYCGAVERLPADRAGWIADLRGRLAARAGAALQFHGADRALAGLFERPRALGGVTGGLAVVVGIVTLASVAGSVPLLASAPAGRLPELLAGALATPLMLASVPASFVVATLVARWRFRSTVRPLLLARAPATEGASARCRACGADLGPSTAPIVRCVYCATESIVGRDLHASRARLLGEERDAYLARARGIAGTANRISSLAGLAMGLTLVLGLSLTFVLLGVAEHFSHTSP